MSPELDFALTAAKEAGQITLKYFRQKSLKVDKKRDKSPVTQADKEAEAKIREQLQKYFPNDGILGEEFDEKGAENQRRWIIDPIDGTKSFIHGVPLYGVMIGFEDAGRLKLGVVNFPALSLCYYAEKGKGAFMNDEKISVSEISEFEEATLACIGGEYLMNVDSTHPFDTIKTKAGLVRGWGDCYAHMLVASGQADFAIDPKMNPWDCAAIIPILEEAGGRCFDYNGVSTMNGRGLLSANAKLGKKLLDMLT